ncbi:MAG: bifunctional demethylmenaquinone methyltransferase/2-methoxy-6-polyprenyl-1,4-benzoquinol methylase UbiE [Balneolales bacterium]
MSEKVRTMFASIADKYDVTNSVISFGTHHRWRKKAVRMSGVQAGMSVLDCATGTGDLALEFKKAVGPEGKVIGTDFCAEMMKSAPAKAAKMNLEVNFETADAMDLPYSDNTFDIASIAFGIRNVDDPLKSLKELARVVKPGGKVIVLEFGQPDGLFKYPYRFYSKHVIPFIGGIMTGNKEAYAYLPETSAHFAAGSAFLSLMKESGQYSSQQSKKLMGGIAYVYVGEVVQSNV